MSKKIVLFVNAIRPATFEALRDYEQRSGQKLTPMVIVDAKIQDAITERNGQKNNPDVAVISTDFDSAASLRKALLACDGDIIAVTSQYENSILELKKLLPYFPYLPMPSESSLDWSTEKKIMRQLLEGYNPSLVPSFVEVTNARTDTISEIETTLSYPMIVKPSGLEGSLLVNLVTNRSELLETLEHTFREIQHAYDTWIKRQEPSVLVEEFMDGDMYSIDTYVSDQGVCRHTPPVKVITGKKVGFDDFFGYMQTTPCGLDESSTALAYHTAEQACRALGLRSVTAHVELMRLSDNRWKIIELGPRIGGYRHDIYNLSYGINHIANDIINRAGETPIVNDILLKHTAAFNIYARQEGVIRKVEGIEIVKSLPSFVSLIQDFFPGDTAKFAKNNGDPIVKVILSHSSGDQFRHDTKIMEQTLRVVIEAS